MQNIPALNDAKLYGAQTYGYKRAVASGFSFGDVIRKARRDRGLSQTALGKEAGNIQIGKSAGPINKSTVSKVENDLYSSEFGTVLRLLAVLNLTLTELERRSDPAPLLRKRSGEGQAPASSGRQARVKPA
jgi:transcriptional regulator with XRE-family HTH domain